MSTHNLCFEQKYEKYQNFLSENFPFLFVKFSIFLNRRVFVMMGIAHSSRKDTFSFKWKILYIFLISPSSEVLLMSTWRHLFKWHGLIWISLLARALDKMLFFLALRKRVYSNILKISPPKTENFQIKKLIFSHFCSKHRLWVLIRTVLERWFWWVPTIYVFEQK